MARRAVTTDVNLGLTASEREDVFARNLVKQLAALDPAYRIAEPSGRTEQGDEGDTAVSR